MSFRALDCAHLGDSQFAAWKVPNMGNPTRRNPQEGITISVETKACTVLYRYLDALGFLSLEGHLNVREVAGTFVK